MRLTPKLWTTFIAQLASEKHVSTATLRLDRALKLSGCMSISFCVEYSGDISDSEVWTEFTKTALQSQRRWAQANIRCRREPYPTTAAAFPLDYEHLHLSSLHYLTIDVHQSIINLKETPCETLSTLVLYIKENSRKIHELDILRWTPNLESLTVEERDDSFGGLSLEKFQQTYMHLRVLVCNVKGLLEKLTCPALEHLDVGSEKIAAVDVQRFIERNELRLRSLALSTGYFQRYDILPLLLLLDSLTTLHIHCLSELHKQLTELLSMEETSSVDSTGSGQRAFTLCPLLQDLKIAPDTESNLDLKAELSLLVEKRWPTRHVNVKYGDIRLPANPHRHTPRDLWIHPLKAVFFVGSKPDDLNKAPDYWG